MALLHNAFAPDTAIDPEQDFNCRILRILTVAYLRTFNSRI